MFVMVWYIWNQRTLFTGNIIATATNVLLAEDATAKVTVYSFQI